MNTHFPSHHNSTMRNEILASINEPKQLETLYRGNKAAFKQAFSVKTFFAAVCIDSKDFCCRPVRLYVVLHLLGALPNGAEFCVTAFWTKWWDLFY